jgi:diguanylate cyclase (GGDEF)-like protein
LGIIAEQLTLLLRHEELTKEKERMATLDPLTGAATRRRLMDRLEYVITQSGRTRMPFSLVIMDLDHFKKFNDTMGHQVGDRLLQDLVKVLSAHVRKGDLVARYGGEEFVVLLPNCAMKDALRVAEDLRERVFDYGVSQREMYKGLPVSISMGAAQWTAPETALALIARADAALYASKHAGRNRVTQAA